MATVEELLEQYKTDPKLQREVARIVADGKVSALEFLAFARRHDVTVSLAELPKYIEEARNLGFIR